MNELNDTQRTLLDAVLAAHPARADALLPVLQAVQRALGCVPAAAVPPIAAALGRSRAEVHGVLGFYADFRGEPVASPLLAVCDGEACQAVGASALAAAAAAAGLQAMTVYCLGNCAAGPAVRLGDRVHGRVTPEGLLALVAAGDAP